MKYFVSQEEDFFKAFINSGLSKANFLKGEFDKAKKFYEQSIEVSDKYAAANYINLGNI